MLLTHLFENKHMTEADIASVNWNTDSESGVAEGGEKDRQWSDKDMEKLRVATRDFDDILSADGPDAFKQELIKKRIQTKPMAGPKGVLPEQGVAEGSLEEIDRRGFLKSMGAAAVAGAAGGANAGIFGPEFTYDHINRTIAQAFFLYNYTKNWEGKENIAQGILKQINEYVELNPVHKQGVEKTAQMVETAVSNNQQTKPELYDTQRTNGLKHVSDITNKLQDINDKLRSGKKPTKESVEQGMAEDSENAFTPLKLNDQKSNVYGNAILDIADQFEDKFSDENASEYATAIATVGHAFLNNGMRSGRAKLFGLEQTVYKHVLMALDQQGFGIVKDLIQPHFKPDNKVPFNNMAEAPGAETLGHNQSTVSSNMKAFDLGEGDISQLEKDVADAPVEPIANMEATEKVGNMDADAFDAAMARLKKLAGAGPLKTVWDPKKRVYRNMPTAVQPKK